MDEQSARITELEIRYTHQARLLEELHEVLLAETRKVADLEREVRILRQTLEGLAPSLIASPDEK